MIFPAPMRSECAVLACSGVMVPETNLKLPALTGWWIPLPISPLRSSRWSMESNPRAPRIEWLAEIIVGVNLETDVGTGEFPGAHVPADVEARSVRQHDIEHDQPDVVRLRRGLKAALVGSERHSKALPGQQADAPIWRWRAF